MERTLLLDQGYQPVTTISWQRAICLLTRGKVEIIEAYDRDVRSVHLSIKVPAVVRLITRFMRSKQRVKFSRPNVLARDKWCCQFCGQKKPTGELTYDHVVPRAQGGKTCWENIVTACIPCNAKKADRTPQQAGMHLKKKPERPDWVPVFTVQISRNTVPDSWKTYCDWAPMRAAMV